MSSEFSFHPRPDFNNTWAKRITILCILKQFYECILWILGPALLDGLKGLEITQMNVKHLGRLGYVVCVCPPSAATVAAETHVSEQLGLHPLSIGVTMGPTQNIRTT